MSTGLFNSAVSGMLSAQIAMQTAQHNISNQSTPGFNRQRVVQTSNIAMLTGSGFIGQGANITTVDRMYDQFLSGQVSSAQTSSSELEAYYSQIAQIDNMLADPSSGLSPALQSFFSGVQSVVTYPTLSSSRQTMMSSAQALVARYQGLDTRLSQLYESVNGQITNQVDAINSYAQQVAALNQNIIVAQSSINRPANDLLDKRDQLVSELNKLVRIDTTVNSDGSFNVFFGSGQALVVGTQVMTLTAKGSSDDPSRLAVGLTNAGGSQEMQESQITGGSLGGLIKFRSESLDKAANDLGRNAASLALTFNAQHALGQDLLGNVAGDIGFQGTFFNLPSPKVLPNTQNPSNAPTLTASYVSPTFDGNYYTNLTNSDYRLDTNTLTLTRLSDNFSWPPAADLAALNVTAATQGFSIAASGPLVANSSYLIQPTRDAAKNLSINSTITANLNLIAVAAPVRTQTGSTNKGNATISSGTVVAGYSASSLPLTLTYASATNKLSGFVGVSATNPVTVTDSQGKALAGSPFTADSVSFTSGATISYMGMSFSISGTPSNNDSFQIVKNTAGVSDGRNASLLGQLQTQKTMSGKTASFQDAYAQLVSDIGNKTRQISVTNDAQTALLEQAQASREALSGVNLDEEAANLIKYQQAYQAAAKSLQIGSGLFDTLLGIMR